MKTNPTIIQWLIVLAVSLVSLATSIAFAQSLTFTSTTYTVGSGPVFPAVADVNGDGKLDLIIPISVFSCADPTHNSSGNTLVVLTNNGSGGFGSNATLTVGTGPLWVVAADVNGDGKPDLISANFSGNSWTVLTNNGSGGFVFSATIPDPVAGYTVANTFAVGDFNGDGKLELICGLGGPSCAGGDVLVLVLTNNGSGVFGSNTTVTAGSCQNVVAADLNGNGKLDVITSNYKDGTVTVLMNTSVFPAPTLTPKLGINLQGNGVRVAWPSASPGWSLQQNTDLRTPNWLPSGYGGYGITDDGTNKSLTMPPTLGNLFFRLLHP